MEKSEYKKEYHKRRNIESIFEILKQQYQIEQEIVTEKRNRAKTNIRRSSIQLKTIKTK